VVTSLAPEPLLALAVTVTSEQQVDSVLQSIVQGLASQSGVALARIWLVPSPDFSDSTVSDPPDCLCLAASAGTPIKSPGEDWCFLHGYFARTDFVTPASSAPELADIVVCRAGLSTAREHVRHSH